MKKILNQKKKINLLSREALSAQLLFYKTIAFSYAKQIIFEPGPLFNSGMVQPTVSSSLGLWNYRMFDPRLLHLKYNLVPVHTLPYFLSFFSYILIKLCVLVFLFALLLFFYLYLDNAAGYGIWELSDIAHWPDYFSYFSSWGFSSHLEILMDYLFSFLGSIYTFLNTKFLYYVEYWAFGWERVVEIGGEKYYSKRPLFDLFSDIYLGSPYYTFFFICALILFQLLLLTVFFFFLAKISDSWRLILNLSQPTDWDLFFLSAEPLNQLLDFDFYDFKSQKKYINSFLYYYKLGFIDNELEYYNTLHKLMTSSRSTFLGYRGFLNLFPTKSVIFDVERFFKRKLVKFHHKNIVYTGYTKTDRVMKSLAKFTLNKFVTLRSSLSRDSTAFYSVISERFFTKLRVLNLAPFSWNSPFQWLTNFKGRNTLLGDWHLRSQLQKFRAIGAEPILSDDDPDRDNLMSMPYFREDHLYNWYERELEFVTTHSRFHLHFRKRQFLNFKHGLSNIVGDFAFFFKETNYHGNFEHEYPDVTAPYFEVEDTMSSLPPRTTFDRIPEIDEEEFVEEEDVEYPDHFFFEDGFLHLDEEDFDLDEEIEEEDIQELLLEDPLLDKKTIMEKGHELRDYDLEREELREDIFDMVGIKLNFKRDYGVTTTSSDYEGKAGLEISTAFAYREGIYDTIYDDLVDFFWLNSDETSLSWFTFARGRFLFQPLHSRRRNKHLIKFRLRAKRMSYAYPAYALNQFLERTPFFLSSFFYVSFFFLLLFFFVFVAAGVLAVDLATVPFAPVLFALANLLIVVLLVFIFLTCTFVSSFFNAIFLLTALPVFSSFLCYFVSYPNLPLFPSLPFRQLAAAKFSQFPKTVGRVASLTVANALEFGYCFRSTRVARLSDSLLFATTSKSQVSSYGGARKDWWGPVKLVPAHLPSKSFYGLGGLSTFGITDPFLSHDIIFDSPEASPLAVAFFTYRSTFFHRHLASNITLRDSYDYCFTSSLRTNNHRTALTFASFSTSSEGRPSQMPDNILSRFFFASLKRNSTFDFIEAQTHDHLDSDFPAPTNRFDEKLERFSRPGRRRIAKNLEPRLGLFGTKNLGLSEVTRLFVSQNLLDRIYSEQVGAASNLIKPQEPLFYAANFGYKTILKGLNLTEGFPTVRSFYRD